MRLRWADDLHGEGYLFSGACALPLIFNVGHFDGDSFDILV